MEWTDRAWSTGVTVLTVGALLFSPGRSAHLPAQEIGPPGGSLVIVGGALSDTTIVDTFLELAGGADAPIVVIPTAGGADDYDQSYERLALFRDRGATDLTVLHTYDLEEANTEEFVAPLRRARGVWFTGGRQWRLADAYLDTRTEEELWRVLERGGVIGRSYVAIYDHGSTLDLGGRFYFLRPGDVFDLKERRALRPTRSLEPLERVRERSWAGG